MWEKCYSQDQIQPAFSLLLIRNSSSLAITSKLSIGLQVTQLVCSIDLQCGWDRTSNSGVFLYCNIFGNVALIDTRPNVSLQ